jgi:hypothetical protein
MAMSDEPDFEVTPEYTAEMKSGDERIATLCDSMDIQHDTGTINVYEPTVGTSAQSTLSNANSTTVPVSDYPMIVSFK